MGGFFRSLQFTCVSTIAYADVSAAVMSRATSLASMAQQLSVSFGVGFAALSRFTWSWWRAAIPR